MKKFVLILFLIFPVLSLSSQHQVKKGTMKVRKKIL